MGCGTSRKKNYDCAISKMILFNQSDPSRNDSVDTGEKTKAIEKLLKGDASVVDKIGMRILKIFLSSTFSDVKIERNYLMSNVWPEIERFCRQRGLIFMVVDFRWGISDRLGSENLTSEICFNEIIKCTEQTIRGAVSFIFLTSLRYGASPLPRTIQSDSIQLVLKLLTEEDFLKFERLYIKDLNCDPCEYVLQSLGSTEEDKKLQEEVYKMLHEATKRFFSTGSVSKKFRWIKSVTHKEVETFFLTKHDSTSGISLHRKIPNFRMETEGICRKFADTAPFLEGVEMKEKLQLLQDIQMEAKNKMSTFEAQIEWDPDGGINPKNPAHLKYLNNMAQFVKDQVVASTETALARDLTDQPLHLEIAQHLRIYRKEHAKFTGRIKKLDEATEWLRTSEREVLVIHGESGCGKTCFLSALMERASDFMEIRIVRYCGTSTNSSRTTSLLFKNIIHQLDAILGGPPATIFETSIKDLLNETLQKVASRTNSRVGLFIDALENLSDSSELADFPNSLPDNCFLAITLDSRRKRLHEKLSMALKGSSKKKEVNQLEIGRLDSKSSRRIFQSWLEASNRNLTEKQKELALNTATSNSNSDQRVFRLEVIHRIASRWTSFDEEPCSFPADSSLRSLIYSEIMRASRLYGENIVRMVAQYVSMSENGINEDELLDILSADDDLMDEVLKYHKPPIRRVPPIVLAQVKRALGGFLEERNINDQLVLAFRHQEVKEVIESKMTATAESWDRMLDYYTGQLSIHFQDRDIKCPKVIMESGNEWKIDGRILSTVIHIFPRISESKFTEACLKSVCTLQFVSAALAAGYSSELLGLYRSMMQLDYVMKSSVFPHLEDYEIFLAQNIQLLREHPQLLPQQVQASLPTVRNSLEHTTERSPFIIFAQIGTNPPWLTSNGDEHLIALETPESLTNYARLTLRAVQTPAAALTLTENILFASFRNLWILWIWDIDNGKTLQTIQVHAQVTQLSALKSKHEVIVAFDTGEIAILMWNIDSDGIFLCRIHLNMLLPFHKDLFGTPGNLMHSLDFNEESCRLVSCCSAWNEEFRSCPNVSIYATTFHKWKPLEGVTSSADDIRDKHLNKHGISSVKFSPTASFIVIGFGRPVHRFLPTVNDNHMISVLSSETLVCLWSIPNVLPEIRNLEVSNLGCTEDDGVKESFYTLISTNQAVILLNVASKMEESVRGDIALFNEGANIDMAKFSPDHTRIMHLDHGVMKRFTLTFATRARCTIQHDYPLLQEPHLCEGIHQPPVSMDAGHRFLEVTEDMNSAITASQNGTIVVWNIRKMIESKGNTGDPRLYLSGVGTFALFGNGKYVFGGQWPGPSSTSPTNHVLWEIGLPRPRKIFSDQVPNEIRSIAVSPDGSYFAYRYDKYSSIVFKPVEPFTKAIQSEETYLVVPNYGGNFVLDIPAPQAPEDKEKDLFDNSFPSTNSLSWSPDGKLLFTNTTVMKGAKTSDTFIINFRERKVQTSLVNETGAGAALGGRFSPNGEWLAIVHSCFYFPYSTHPSPGSGSLADAKSQLVLWSTEEWLEVSSVDAGDDCTSFGTSEAGQLFWGFTTLAWISETIIAAGSSTGTLYLLSVPHLNVLSRVRLHDSIIVHTTALQSKSMLVTGSVDHWLKVFRWSDQKLSGIGKFFIGHEVKCVAITETDDLSVRILATDALGRLHSLKLREDIVL